MPELSIVMPMYNAAAYVEHAVQSLLSQTFRDFELIVVDDASTDGSAERVHRLGDPRVRVLTNERNMGIVFSRNRGLNASVGRYYAPFDADDVAFPNKFERQIGFMNGHPRFGMVGSWARMIDRGGNSLPGTWKLPAQPEQIPSILLFRNYFVNSSTLIQRDALPEGGYREGFDIGEDYVMWTEMARRTAVWNLPEYLVYVRQHPESTTKKDPECLRQYERKVFRHLFGDIGMVLSDADCRALLQLKGRAPISASDDLMAIENLLLTILRNNVRMQAFDPVQLRRTLRDRWMKACFLARGDFFRALARFVGSPLLF